MLSKRPWLLSCDNVKKLNKIYNNYKIIYQEQMINTIELWDSRFKTSYEKKLDKNILFGNQNDQFWHLTINLDWYIFK